MKFGFLVFPGMEELDLVGPWEMISLWGEFLHGPETRLLVAESREPVRCAKGMSLNAGIDLAFAFIESVTGEAVAGKVQFAAEYYPSGRFFGTFHQSPEAPAYLRRGPARSQEHPPTEKGGEA